VWAEQAVFTSLIRRGRGGYHLVSRSKGVDGADAQALSRWGPSHGALIVDENNRVSVNFHPLPSGRFALSRTCAGPAEYSGRGGKQLYTHFLILEEAVVNAVAFNPFAIYRDAMAHGYFIYQFNPKETLEPLPLCEFYEHRAAEFWMGCAVELGFSQPKPIVDRLAAGQTAQFVFRGDRAALAECLLGMLPAEVMGRTSFATSLVPSSVRPFVLTLLGADQK
jgi:GTPase-associated protein 1, N-terminal domain type 2